ncbi:MAG: tRNA threonylcarbamoyladenosine biosynthesis protein RimN [Candidatus Muproteobacteria bacterium RBG_16_62_13]|uniref:L-threonylcarbamoyladenylate synthase n=1 Tax=Candidatus Muproteobacteria bacterium RBG_16_62_13 TaxID=1817756 RepID=A0A1F6T212_9PROT|nr:MAG: tRNA threonylcarbamoyladenosine biosynthesis protein RimN [Candidatus Muproteobacteria bacterium RBG_16_62_13]
MYTRDLQHAARVLKQGGLVAYATEYCFGLGCDPFNRDAVLRLLRIKRRPVKNGLIVLAADVAQLAPYVREVPDSIRNTWPGPHTWLLPVQPGVPGWITGAHDTIAVRVTAHPPAAALCRAAGMAIISTSANRAGSAPARSEREVLRRFARQIDCVLSGRVGGARAPTAIRDAASGALIRPS